VAQSVQVDHPRYSRACGRRELGVARTLVRLFALCRWRADHLSFVKQPFLQPTLLWLPLLFGPLEYQELAISINLHCCRQLPALISER
jgi:hypothetical protein